MLQPMPALNSTKRIDFVIMMFQQLGERVKHRYRAGKLRPQCCAT
jgi:hypothetical protein